MFAASKSGSAADPIDPQFNYVTMLLHGDGTNGAQNNTFLDSSTNNFTITRNGNTTQGTFTPYGSNWSNYFDGSSYLNAGTNAAFAVGTGDFTIEFWVFPTAFSGTYTGYFTTRTGGQGFDIQILNSSATLMLGNNSGAVISANNVLSLNTWQHVCAVRSGSTNSLYVNGTRVATGTDSTNFTDNGAKVCSSGPSGGNNGVGYISNLRLVKGTAVYNPSSSTITVPTTPLTAISGTSLLTTQSNRFIDNSTNAFSITTSGSPSVQRFSPFSPTTAYSTSVIGGSGYFDGSDSLSISSSNTILPTGTQDFSVELSVYWQTQSGSYPQIISNPTTNGFQIYYDVGSSLLAVGIFNVANVITYSIAQSDLSGAWTHIAVTRSGNTFRLFVNGVLRANGTNTISFASPTTQYIASDGSRPYTGYITDVRTCLGSIPTSYQTSSTTNGTSIFSPPTAPLTTSSQGAANTALLLSYTNAGILDNAMMNDLETVGNAQISTSVKKYGTGSMYFDGSGDYLSTITSPNLNMGTGNWTIECWVYILSRTLNYPLIFGNNNGGYTSGALSIVNSNADSGASIDRFCLSVKDISNSPTLVASSTNSSNTWYHLAVVRNGTSLVMYRDGTSVASTTISSGIVFDWGKLGSLIGGGNWDGAQSYFNGYIDELRISKVARYTANFTAPTAAFPNN